MTKKVETIKIAKALGAEARGKVRVRSGYFGAIGLLADIEVRFRVSGENSDLSEHRVEPMPGCSLGSNDTPMPRRG
jgi:hypothetical protein